MKKFVTVTTTQMFEIEIDDALLQPEHIAKIEGYLGEFDNENKVDEIFEVAAYAISDTNEIDFHIDGLGKAENIWYEKNLNHPIAFKEIESEVECAVSEA